MSTRQELIPVKLANGSEIRVAATMLGGEEDVAFKLLSFDEVTNTIEGIADALNAPLQGVAQNSGQPQQRSGPECLAANQQPRSHRF